MSFLHELLFFFINSFLSFPLHIKRIILCFVYSDDHQQSFVYPSLEEDDLHSACVVDVDHISSPHPFHKDDVCIQVLPEIDQPCNREDDETDLSPSQILSPTTITAKLCNQFVKPHFHPTNFHSRVRHKMFKPLKLPSHLHPYPPNFVEYLL
jgi:hypothetical protein